jgi:hypothetical protein
MSYFLFSGECQNSSPAGKRRIAAGAEQGGESNMAAVHGGTASDFRLHQYTPFTTVTAMAVAGCIAVVLLFGIIFAVLQVW